jgi:type IV secretion system protein VirD4
VKNNYSSFISQEEIQQELKRVSSKKDIEKGGIALCYDDEAIYLDEEGGHSLIIGSTGSGKTQTTILPKVYTSIYAGENLVVDDMKGEIYEMLKNDLETNNYKVFKFDFNSYSGNKWNPLDLVYKLYQDNNIDDTVMILEKIANYVLSESNSANSDPFWKECCIQLFVGTALYIMEKENRLVTIKDIADYASKITDEEYNKLDDNSAAKIFLRVIMTAPKDTKGSIISVFNNLIMCYSYSNKINDFLSKSDFNLEELLEEKVALFITDCHDKQYITNLISIFIEELLYVCEKKRNNRRINIVLDDFNDYVPFDSLGKMLISARSSYITVTACSTTLHRLVEIYGETTLEHIIACFSKVIYLYANDEYTLEYVSNMCGNKNVDEKLITPTELKLLKTFECIILKSRHLPFKSKLLPFYQYTIK